MTTYEEIFEFSRPEFVSSISVKRIEEQGVLQVNLQIESNGQEKNLNLSGFDELAECVSYFLVSERVVVSKEIGTGKEFGTIRIECWNDECYSVHWCDTAA